MHVHTLIETTNVARETERESHRDRHCQPVARFVFDILPIGSDKILSYLARKYLK